MTDKNKSRKKVLIMMRDLRIGSGITSCIMNYYEGIVCAGYKVDFLLMRNMDSPYVKYVRKNGSRIYVLPNDTSKPNLSNKQYIKNILQLGWDIVHINISGLNALIAMKEAAKRVVKCRIYHCHAPRETSSLKAVVRSFVYENITIYYANQYIACTEKAGTSIFGKKDFLVLKNIIDSDKYAFDIESREFYRKELGIEENFVVGTVGHFVEAKNPMFTIDILNSLLELNPRAVLLWVGDGPMYEKVISKVKKNGLDKHLICLGVRTDVNKLYSAMDVFVLPSFFEGLGIVYLEAQASGLPCFASLGVPQDIKISELVHFLSIHGGAATWAKEIDRCKVTNDLEIRSEFVTSVKKAGYDLNCSKAMLAELYLQFC